MASVLRIGHQQVFLVTFKTDYFWGYIKLLGIFRLGGGGGGEAGGRGRGL